MEPMVAARLLQAAMIERSDAVLIIGAGTGYESALAAMLARSVVALEEHPELARRARAAPGSVLVLQLSGGPYKPAVWRNLHYRECGWSGFVDQSRSRADNQACRENANGNAARQAGPAEHHPLA